MANKNPKIQATLDGYDAWVWDKLLALTGKKNHSLGVWIFNRWIERDRDYLKSVNLTLEDYSRETKGNVIRHPGASEEKRPKV